MKYVFTETQFQIFLAVAEAGSILCFSCNCEISDQELVYGLSELFSQGWLEESGGRLTVSHNMKLLTEGMKQSQSVLQVTYGRRDRPECLVYSGCGKEEFVVVEKRDMPSGNVVRMWRTSCRDFFSELLDDEMIGTSITGSREAAGETEAALLFGPDPAKEEERLILQIQSMRNADGHLKRRIRIYDGLLCWWISIAEEGQGELRHVYSREECCRLLLEEMERSV